jgi:hypothetical protein
MPSFLRLPSTCACAASLFLFVCPAQPQSPAPAQQASRIKLESVAKVLIANDTPAYLVSYSYDFDKMPNVYIKGLGVVPSKGSYQYISREQELEFRDPTTNAVLERVPIQETMVVAAKPPLNQIAGDNQFSQAYRAYSWEQPTPLQERANTVLAKYFNYLPRENNKLTYLATTYTQLPLDKKFTDRGVLAQVALLLSFPYDPTTGKYSFHVQYSAKEGRALSDELKSTNNEDILRAANEFVDKIVSEMKTVR